MKLSGTADVDAGVEEVFERLLDPAVLTRCIPGCERLEQTAPGVYATWVKAGIGAIKGKFTGEVTLSDVVRPESYRLALVGKSTVGHVQGGADIRLEPGPKGTVIRYEGDAKVSGMIASVGGRLVDVAARTIVRQFFERLAGVVSSGT